MTFYTQLEARDLEKIKRPTSLMLLMKNLHKSTDFLKRGSFPHRTLNLRDRKPSTITADRGLHRGLKDSNRKSPTLFNPC